MKISLPGGFEYDNAGTAVISINAREIVIAYSDGRITRLELTENDLIAITAVEKEMKHED